MTPSRFSPLTLVSLSVVILASSAGPAQEKDLPPGAIARLGSTRFLHGDRAFAMALTRDEKGIVIASQEDVVRLWDRASGTVIRTFASEGSSQVFLALSPDGTRLAAGDNGSNLRLWDFATGKLIAKHRCSETVRALAWSEDGKTLAASDGNAIALFDQELKPTRRLEGHPKFVRRLLFAGELLLSSGGEQKIAVWDVASGKRLRLMEGETDWNGAISLSADKKRVAADLTIPTGPKSYRSLLGVWDVESGKLVLELPGSSTNCVLFTSDGGTLFSGDSDGRVRVWDLTTGKETRKWRAHVGSVSSMTLADEGKTLITGGSDYRVRFFDAETGKEHNAPVGHSGPVQAVVFSPDGRDVISAGKDGTIRFWDWAAGREIRRIDDLGTFWGVEQLGFVGDTLVSLEKTPSTAVFRRWTGAGKPLGKFGLETQHVSRFVPLPDGKNLAGACWDGAIGIWNLESGKLDKRIPVHKQRLLTVAVAPDGKSFAWAGEYHDLGYCDAAGKEIRSLKVGSLRSEVALAFAPDGTLLAGSSYDGVHLWQEFSGKPALTIPDSGGVGAMAFSPDGTTLAMLNGTKLLLWDVIGRQYVGGFVMERDFMEAFAWSGDGRMLAAATRGGSVLVWDATDGGLDKGKLKPVALDAKEGGRLWEDLASTDAGRARRAAWRLAASADGIAPLAERLRPVAGIEPEKLDRLIADLNDDDFLVRQKANQELAGIGQGARDALEKTAAKGEVEARSRAKELLRKLGSDPVILERRRSLRAVALLEWAGTEAARKVLTSVASGAPAAQLTKAAQAALGRLAKR